MFFTVIVLLSVILNAYCQNVSSNCVFPQKLLNDCAEVVPDNSTNQMIKRYPWHVALYRLKDNTANAVPINVCGGTLISSSVMLTAAHCLAEDQDGSLRNISEYFVAAGNEFRSIDDDRDLNNRQIRQISKVIVPAVYKGHQSGFRGDIAIVELNEGFILTDFVRPACPATKTALLKGETVGWGLTVAHRDPDTILTRVIVPHIDLTTCIHDVDQQFHQYLTDDKFCGEFSKGGSICSTDNGGGILHTEEDNGKTRWFLDGITSVGLISGGDCNTKQFSAFTRIHDYFSLICQSVVKNLNN